MLLAMKLKGTIVVKSLHIILNKLNKFYLYRFNDYHVN